MGLAAGISKVWSSKAPTGNCTLNSRFTKLRRGWGKGPYGSSSAFLSYRQDTGARSRAGAGPESLCPEWQDPKQKPGHLTLGTLFFQWYHSLALPVTSPAILPLAHKTPGPPTTASSVFGQRWNSNPSSRRPYAWTHSFVNRPWTGLPEFPHLYQSCFHLGAFGLTHPSSLEYPSLHRFFRRFFLFLWNVPQISPLLRSQHLPLHLKSLTLPLFSMSQPRFVFSQSAYQSSILYLYYLFLYLIILFFFSFLNFKKLRTSVLYLPLCLNGS